MVIEIQTTEEFNNLVKDPNYAVTIVDFHASWCPPCKAIKPFYEELSKKHTDVQFLKVDVDTLADVAAEAGIRAMPTFVIYKKGEKTDQILEGADRDTLSQLVRKASKITPKEVTDERDSAHKNLSSTNDKKATEATQTTDSEKETKCNCQIL